MQQQQQQQQQQQRQKRLSPLRRRRRCDVNVSRRDDGITNPRMKILIQFLGSVEILAKFYPSTSVTLDQIWRKGHGGYVPQILHPQKEHFS
ncbi:hypothetical protein CRUP_035271, partial [Coryphaenoides rupestris]